MKYFLVLICLSFILQTHSIAMEPQVTGQKIDSLLRSWNQEGKFNGSLLVGIRGKILYHGSYGYADLEDMSQLDTSSVFCLASVSKIFTSAAIFLLEKQGSLSVHDPVRKYLPELPPCYDAVRLTHLLSHTSGTPEIYKGWQSLIGKDNADILAALSEVKELDFTPGEKYCYSNNGYILLASVAERVSGIAFGKFLESKLFSRFGMKSSFVRQRDAGVQSSLVHSYNTGIQADWPLYTYGPGGICSTTGDLWRWDQAFFGGKVFDWQTIDRILDPGTLNSGARTTYGLGWGVIRLGGILSVGHTGGMFGFRTLYEHLPGQGICLVILTSMGDSCPLMELRT